MFKKLFDLFKVPSRKEQEYSYLAESVDTFDLERRIKDIQNGRAPFQRPYY